MYRIDSPRSPRRPRELARAETARRRRGRLQPLTLANLRTLRWMSPEVVTARRNERGGVLVFLLGATGGDKEEAIRALARGARCPVSRIDIGRLLAAEIGIEPSGLAAAFDLARRARSLMVVDSADNLFGQPPERIGSDMLHRRLWRMIETYPGTVIIATGRRPPVISAKLRRDPSRSH